MKAICTHCGATTKQLRQKGRWQRYTENGIVKGYHKCYLESLGPNWYPVKVGLKGEKR